MREYEKVWPSIVEKIVKPLRADVFIHTWDVRGKQISISQGSTGPKPSEKKPIEENKIIDFLWPHLKKIEISNNNTFFENEKIDKKIDKHNDKFILFAKKINDTTWDGSAHPKLILSQLYSIYRSYMLMKEYEEVNNIKYNFIFKSRIDYMLSSSIDFSDLSSCKENQIFIPHTPCSSHGHPVCDVCLKSHKTGNFKKHFHNKDICDVFAYGKSKQMGLYMNNYTNWESTINSMHKENLKILKDVAAERSFGINEISHSLKGVDIWRNDAYKINCFYPERLLMFLLRDSWLVPSKLCGRIVR